MFDVTPAGPDRFIGETGIDDGEDRLVVEGTQVLAQAVVAAAKRFPDKSVRSAHAVFSRPIVVETPVELVLEVVHEGRSTATVLVFAEQKGKRCAVITVLADVPTEDVIRHHAPRPDVAAPEDANDSPMGVTGREVDYGHREGELPGEPPDGWSGALSFIGRKSSMAAGFQIQSGAAGRSAEG